MKDVQATINPTEVKMFSYNNNFTKKPGDKFQFQVKTNTTIRLNNNSPVDALVVVSTTVEDPDGCIDIKVETITGIRVSTFIDDLEGFIREKYLATVIHIANEKVRALTSMVGMPIRLPSPVLGQPLPVNTEGLPQ